MTEERTSRSILERVPTKEDKLEIHVQQFTPSEWLQQLCPNWVHDYPDIVSAMDRKLEAYKPYLKGSISAELLCRSGGSHYFWEELGVENSFDRDYLITELTRFAKLFAIGEYSETVAAASILVHSTGGAGNCQQRHLSSPSPFLNQNAAPLTTTTTAAAHQTPVYAQQQTSRQCSPNYSSSNSPYEQQQVVTAGSPSTAAYCHHNTGASYEDAAVLFYGEKDSQEYKQQQRSASRESQIREQNKDAAIKRAGELVHSHRVPIEIIRGVSPHSRKRNSPDSAERGPGGKKPRSNIVVSTAADLHAIVTHSQNLFNKYARIAKEHNQKVTWVTVAREIGINVKVREKYARYHARALARGFDFEKNGHLKIKDHPQIFREPTNSTDDNFSSKNTSKIVAVLKNTNNHGTDVILDAEVTHVDLKHSEAL